MNLLLIPVVLAVAFASTAPARAQGVQQPTAIRATGYPEDVAQLGFFGASRYSYGITKKFNMDACLERELHDGQWLAGGCKDILFVLRRRGNGDTVKTAHLGFAVMKNAERGNTSLQLKGGLDLGSAAQAMQAALNIAAPRLAEIGSDLPPWTGKLGNMLTLDFAIGYRPIHDASVNGELTYGVIMGVNVPIQETFEWLVKGL